MVVRIVVFIMSIKLHKEYYLGILILTKLSKD